MPTPLLRSVDDSTPVRSAPHAALTFTAPPEVRVLSDILPDDPLLMMGAGPVPIPEAVARANSVVINHLGATMSTIISQVKEMGRYVFQTKSEWVMGVAGPGSAAMEMAISNLVLPGHKVLCVVNGFFSARMAEMSRRLGAEVITFDVDGHHYAPADEVEALIAQHRPECLTIVQGETSNTVFNRELPAIARAAKKYGCLVIVDAVCTLSTMPLQMDDWQIDAVITGGQKGLSSIPGVSLIAFSNEAWDRINSRTTTNSHWCLDAKLAENFWHKGGYHYTAPVSGVLALHEALRLVCAETLEERFARHYRCSQALQNGIEAMGLRLFTPPTSRLNSVVGIAIPDGMNNADICAHISNRYHVEISGSFGLPMVRSDKWASSAARTTCSGRCMRWVRPCATWAARWTCLPAWPRWNTACITRWSDLAPASSRPYAAPPVCLSRGPVAAAFPACIVTTPSIPADDPAPEPPERPGDNQCCQSGCEPCIFDLYAEDMQAWRDDFRAWELRQASRKAAG